MGWEEFGRSWIFFVLCAGFIWMLFGMGCMDKNASTFLLPHFFKGFCFICVVFFHLPRLCNAIMHCNSSIDKLIYKYFAFCMAYMQFKKEMHKYLINDTKN